MPFKPKRILTATDFSSCARQAVDAAADLAGQYGAELTVLHVIPLSVYLDFAAGIEGHAGDSIEYQQAVRSAVKQSIVEEKERLRSRGVTAEFLIREGPPALEVAAAAKEGHFDLVVVGTHGRTGLKHVLLGSVAEGIVRHSLTPVLTLRG